jgi:ribonuclease P protein component
MPEQPPQPGSPSGSIWRVRDRASFVALRRHGRRARRDGLAVSWLPPEQGSTPPRIAVAASRRAGGAVVRNRIRRRLRAACAELARAGRLPSGTYLLIGDTELYRMPWPALVELVERTASAARERASR